MKVITKSAICVKKTEDDEHVTGKIHVDDFNYKKRCFYIEDHEHCSKQSKINN